MGYIAHKREDGAEQPLLEHLEGSARLAREFGEAFGVGELAGLAAMLHDIGKYSKEFQRRIRGGTERVDHSTAGALEALYKFRNPPAAFCIAGHHGGLPDGGNQKSDIPEDNTFFGKIRRQAGVHIPDYSAYQKEVEISSPSYPTRFYKDTQSGFFFTRMLYSCLVDADYLDTEEFMTNGSVQRGEGMSLTQLNAKLEQYIFRWQNPDNDLNRQRCRILNALQEEAEQKAGLFSLSVPTGGGKTVASMAFALRHAIRNGQRRIIYVIPYTSIIDQTSQVFAEIFGPENVLAHHSNVDYSGDEDRIGENYRYLAAENWDAPIILTTAVQFFESLYANRSSRCRKLHNIPNSVIIFDEAQMLPIACLRPCLSAIAHLVRDYDCSAVLCTATQPSLGRLFRELLPDWDVQELCPQKLTDHPVFQRVNYINEGSLSDDDLVERLIAEKQALCVVNNRRQAQKIASLLPEEGRFHLSTTMYPAHRERVLADIHRLLDAKLPCRLISTSLIEAGVDVDFPAVYRALAGLDSLIQAAGRCNREGKNPFSDSLVHIFASEQKAPSSLTQNIAAAQHVLREHEDISTIEAIKSYFDFLLYTLKDDRALDQKQILPRIAAGNMPFASVAEDFHIINKAQYTVYIPQGEGHELWREYRQRTEQRQSISRRLLRRLGRYGVSVYPEHFWELKNAGALELADDNTAFLLDQSLYNEAFGLTLNVGEGRGLFE